MLADIVKVACPDPGFEDNKAVLPPAVISEIVTNFRLNRGHKSKIHEADFFELGRRVEQFVTSVIRGGSGGTMGLTLARLLPWVNIRYGTVFAGSPRSDVFAQEFRDAKIELFPRNIPAGITPRSAVSYMLVAEGEDERTFVNDSGTFGEVMRQVIKAPVFLHDCDVLHLLGTNRENERLSIPLFDELLTERWNEGKQLWVNLPTHENFAKDNAEYFQWLICSANIVLGNMDELKWTMGIDDKDQALKKLQDLMKKNILSTEGHLGNNREPVAFITDDKNDAFIVTASKIIPSSPPGFVPKSEIKNKGGAGDTCLGGFLAGYVSGLPYEMAALVGHILAAEKLRQDETSLKYPRDVLHQNHRELNRRLFFRVIGGPQLQAA